MEALKYDKRVMRPTPEVDLDLGAGPADDGAPGS